MKLLGLLMLGLLLVFSLIDLRYVRADEADEARETGLKYYTGVGVKLTPFGLVFAEGKGEE